MTLMLLFLFVQASHTIFPIFIKQISILCSITPFTVSFLHILYTNHPFKCIHTQVVYELGMIKAPKNHINKFIINLCSEVRIVPAHRKT